MSGCGRVSRKPFKICAGELKRKILIIDKSIEPDDVSYTENFDKITVAYARIDTTSGAAMFNNVNIEDSPTHYFYIRFGFEVERNFTIEFNSNYFHVLDVENLNEENRFLKISARKGGPKSQESNWA